MTTRVLLVDDNESNRLTLAALLESEAFEVTEASSLGEARQSLAQAPAFDLALVDCHLSDGLGLELIPALRAQLPSCKIMVISGGGQADQASAILGADGYFRKGDDLDRLFGQIEQLLSV